MAAKKLLAAETDPNRERRAIRATKIAADANTFDAMAAELLDKKRREGLKQDRLGKFKRYISKASALLGKLQLLKLKPPIFFPS